jgi:glycosyltransferase involved in cell wall biosynthesis
VASRVGGIPEAVIDAETGVLTEPGDAAALARELIRVLRNPELRTRLGAAARRHARERFSPAAMVSGNLGVYREVLDAG